MAYKYAPMFQLGPDQTEYYKIPGSEKLVSTGDFEGNRILKVSREALSLLSETAFHDVNFLLRREHNRQVADILEDPDSTENDKYVALTFLRNAEIAAKGKLPFCQDTGTAIIHAEKGQNVWTGFDEAEPLSEGISNTYLNNALRYSQNVAYDMYTEKNSKCNLPAQIDIEATEGEEFKFLCVVKGGGSANKTYLYQQTKAILRPDVLVPFLTDKIRSLGTAACPPYHVAIVVGGTSAEKNLLTVKLASTKYYDSLPTVGDDSGRAFRDLEMEEILRRKSEELGLGAQFGGTHFVHDIRVVRLSRHGASCPVGLGVSCSADRNIKARIDAEGVWIEKMDDKPYELIPEEYRNAGEGKVVSVDLNKPISEVCRQLSEYPVSTRLSLNGTIIVARDIAHAKLKERLDNGEDLPQYFKDHPVLYAGPAKTPEGMACGSMGPTTANRMDPYVDEFQSRGGSLIMIAKGNRTQQVTDACKKHGGFYLGSIGGPAAVLSQQSIKSIECVEFPELGMEAIWKIEVENFPAFILVDDKGNDFFKQFGL
ncbi:MAG: fumarate hydratase [Bacteroidales bacterium]|nr:fumarate hydratase [Bacteroidales bacterium]